MPKPRTLLVLTLPTLLATAISIGCDSGRDDQNSDSSDDAVDSSENGSHEDEESAGSDDEASSESPGENSSDADADSDADDGDSQGTSTVSENSSDETSTTTGDDPYAQARKDCVDRINGFRASIGVAALSQWSEEEPCTDEQSRKDSENGTAHSHFGDCHEFAQNTCPGWGSVQQVIQGCLQAMWDEGPGEPFEEHGHYINMANASYTKVACGFYEMPDGKIWHNHNFR
jgi:hypothetical protein